jgi:hypothetical protein
MLYETGDIHPARAARWFKPATQQRKFAAKDTRVLVIVQP